MENQLNLRLFTKVLFVGAAIAVAILSILAGITVNEPGCARYLRLVREGAKCEAIITIAEAANDCLVQYSFSIEGRNYCGTGSDCGARVGRKVTITYLPADPSQSCLGPAGEKLADQLVSFLFGGLGSPPLS